jgi:hypothetical protein
MHPWLSSLWSGSGWNGRQCLRIHDDERPDNPDTDAKGDITRSPDHALEGSNSSRRRLVQYTAALEACRGGPHGSLVLAIGRRPERHDARLHHVSVGD